MINPVELVRKTDSSPISIEALVTADGDLLLVGKEEHAADEQEYWLRVPAQAKDAALLALLLNFFSGNATAVADLRALLLANGVPCELHSH